MQKNTFHSDSFALPDCELPPLVVIAGHSGAGKTTFLEGLIPEITRRGFFVGTLKHDLHGFELDKPGKDSWRHKKAGAAMTMISSPFQIGMLKDVSVDHQPQNLLPFYSGMDIVFCEGFKQHLFPKIEILRREMGSTPICKGDKNLIAVVTDQAVADISVPCFGLEDACGIADFLVTRFGLKSDRSSL